MKVDNAVGIQNKWYCWQQCGSYITEIDEDLILLLMCWLWVELEFRSNY